MAYLSNIKNGLGCCKIHPQTAEAKTKALIVARNNGTILLMVMNHGFMVMIWRQIIGSIPAEKRTKKRRQSPNNYKSIFFSIPTVFYPIAIPHKISM